MENSAWHWCWFTLNKERFNKQCLFVFACLNGKDTYESLFPLLSVVVYNKRVNIWLHLPHVLVNLNQTWVIDATWVPLFLMRSKVTYWGQKSSEIKLIDWKYKVVQGCISGSKVKLKEPKNVQFDPFAHLRSNWNHVTPTGGCRIKVICHKLPSNIETAYMLHTCSALDDARCKNMCEDHYKVPVCK